MFVSYVIVEECSSGIVRLLLNREQIHNALNQDLIEQLITTLLDLQTRKDLRVLQISGKGRSFCAGADLNWMKESVHLTPAQNKDQALDLAKLLETLAHFPFPTMALTQGSVFGGGVGLVAACDIALTVKEARFCLSEVKLGLIPALISPFVFQAMGARCAQKLILTAEVFNGEQATQWGLTHTCVDSLTDLEKCAKKTTDFLLKGGPEAHREVKELGRFLKTNPTPENLNQTLAEKIASLRTSPEAQEGLAAFLEKRPPQWVKDQN